MASAVSVDRALRRGTRRKAREKEHAPTDARKEGRITFAKKARQLADQLEGLHVGLEQVDAFREIYRFSLIHEQIPDLDLLQTAKTLRAYAGTLSLIASTAPKPQPRPD